MAPVSEFSESGVSFKPSRKHTMKVPALLFVAFWATASCSPGTSATTANENSNPNNSELNRAAAAQLERLAPFRRVDENNNPGSSGGSKLTRQASNSAAAAAKKGANELAAEPQFQIPIDFVELFRIFGLDATRDRRSDVQLTPDKMSQLDKYADKIMQDERVQSYMQERIKRDGYGGGYGPPAGGGGSGGSGAFVSGLAGQLVGSVVGLSSTSSKGSSSSGGHNPAPVYGPPSYHSYGKESFSIWDFKRAILNTLIQAVKAIGGGVLALKGQLIKGSGFLVSTKGRIISSAGEAITGLGKNLASSAVVHPPAPAAHPGYGHVGYAYETPAIVSDAHYDGPPPSPDAYHSTFGTASDDDDTHPGLLIAKPTPSVEIHSDHLQSDHIPSEHHESEHLHTDNYHTEHTHYEDLNAANPLNAVKSVVNHLTGTSVIHPNNLAPPETHSVEEPKPIAGNALQLQDYNQQNYDLYPPLGNGPSDDDKLPQQPPKYDTPVDFNGPSDYPQKYEYTPDISYKAPFGLPPKYGSPPIDYQPHNYLPPRPYSHRQPDIQIEISDHDITGFETGGYSQHKRHHPAGLHVVAMQGPLKIPILGPNVPGYYKYGYPPMHMNAIAGVGKYPMRYGPGFEVHQSIGYEIKNRRDASKIKRT